MSDKSEMPDRPADKISKAQRERHERERQERWRLRNELHAFALWLHPTWDEDNEDDVEASLGAVDTFLADREADRA